MKNTKSPDKGMLFFTTKARPYIRPLAVPTNKVVLTNQEITMKCHVCGGAILAKADPAAELEIVQYAA